MFCFGGDFKVVEYVIDLSSADGISYESSEAGEESRDGGEFFPVNCPGFGVEEPCACD